MYDGTIFFSYYDFDKHTNPKLQTSITAAIDELTEAVSALAVAVVNGELKDKHKAARLVEEVAGRIAEMTS